MQAPINPDYDVAIVGAGPTGITAANLLGRYGVRTLVVDREDDILMIPRAVGMCEEGSRVLDAAGVLERVEDGFHPINNVLFDDKDMCSRFHADVDWRKDGYRSIRMFHQPTLETRMRECLAAFPQVELFTGTELIEFRDDGEHVELRLRRNGEELRSRCRFLLGCDGASSPIRKTLGIGFSGRTYPQDWLILDIENNPLPGNNISFYINPERPGVTLPGPDGRRRWEFVVKKDDDIESIFDEDNLASLLKPWGDMSGIRIDRKAIYSFHARTAQRYQEGNVFLLGDAAHVTPPFAGQGMMAGLRDAYNLCWKLKAVLDGRVNRTLLASYSAERVPQSRQIINFAQFVGSIVLPQDQLPAKVRDTVFRLLGLFGVHSEFVGLPIRKLPNHINGGLLRHKLVSGLFGTGTELPQYPLDTPCGRRLPSDRALGCHYRVIGWNCDPAEYLSGETQERWRAIGGEISTFTSRERFDTPNHLLLDRSQRYRSLFNGGRRIIVIRPDKMMVIRCDPRRLEQKLSRYLDALMPVARAA